MTTPDCNVVHFTGTRCRYPDDAHWLSLDTTELRAQLRDAMDNLSPAAVFGSLAAGADILIAEQALARNCPLHVFVPRSLEWFARHSVRPAGGDWPARFETVVARARDIRIQDDPEPVFASVTRRALDAASHCADAARASKVQLAIWDSGDTGNPNGTAADMRQARTLGFQSIILPARPAEAD